MRSTDTSPLSPGTRVIVRGRAWTITARTVHPACAAIGLRAHGPSCRDDTRTLLAPFDRFLPADRTLHLRVVKPAKLLHCLRRIASRARPAGGVAAAAGATIDILPYQLEPALAAAAGATRILIADAVGLGKTVQAGLVVAHVGSQLGAAARVLIATPAGLREQWRSELERHFALAATVADTPWLLRRGREVPPDVNPWALPDIYITSFDLLKRPEVLRPIEEVTWDALIVDEAHNAAPGTTRRAALDAVARRARRVILLTATPHAGDDGAHAALLNLGAVSHPAKPPIIFRRTRASLGASLARRTTLLTVRLTAAERRMHRQLAAYTAQVAGEARSRGDRRARLAAVVLRKRALSSAASLALSAARRLDLLAGASPCDTQQLFLPFAEEDPLEDQVGDDVLAAPGLADAGQERSVLAAILESATRAAAAESKVGRLVRLLARVGEPAIVFTEYRDTLTRLVAALEAAGVHPLTLHGGQPLAERAGVQREFNSGSRLLIATDAACEGLNLHTRCRLVVHYELPWTPARLEQRTGRVDRIGQRRRVHEILLIARDTAERMVLAPLAARAARARRAVPGASPLLDRLTESDVAAAVLEREALPHVPPSPCLSEWGFRAAADAEAARLHLLRGFAAASPAPAGGATPDALWLCAPRRHRPARLVDAVYALEILAMGGEAVHSELLVARVQISGAPFFRTAADLRHWADGWLRDEGPEVARRALARLHERIDAAAARVRRTADAMVVREAAIASALTGTSRDLVQAGLFDRRALRARDSDRRAALERASAADMRRASFDALARLTPGLRLVALVAR